jgi:uncharacterized membrane protein YphA (DoxX/SURF4 family)
MNSTLQAQPAPIRLRARKWPDYAGLIGRWVLAFLFLYLGWTKALHPEVFLKSLRQYDLTTSSLILNSVAAALPWFEVFCGLLLLFGVAVRGVALLVLAMLVPFTWVVFQRALALGQAQHIPFCAVRLDCGCGTGEVLICRKVVENILLIALTCFPLLGFGRHWSLRFTLAKSPPAVEA